MGGARKQGTRCLLPCEGAVQDLLLTESPGVLRGGPVELKEDHTYMMSVPFTSQDWGRRERVEGKEIQTDLGQRQVSEEKL